MPGDYSFQEPGQVHFQHNPYITYFCLERSCHAEVGSLSNLNLGSMCVACLEFTLVDINFVLTDAPLLKMLCDENRFKTQGDVYFETQKVTKKAIKKLNGMLLKAAKYKPGVNDYDLPARSRFY